MPHPRAAMATASAKHTKTSSSEIARALIGTGASIRGLLWRRLPLFSYAIMLSNSYYLFNPQKPSLAACSSGPETLRESLTFLRVCAPVETHIVEMTEVLKCWTNT